MTDVIHDTTEEDAREQNKNGKTRVVDQFELEVMEDPDSRWTRGLDESGRTPSFEAIEEVAREPLSLKTASQVSIMTEQRIDPDPNHEWQTSFQPQCSSPTLSDRQALQRTGRIPGSYLLLRLTCTSVSIAVAQIVLCTIILADMKELKIDMGSTIAILVIATLSIIVHIIGLAGGRAYALNWKQCLEYFHFKSWLCLRLMLVVSQSLLVVIAGMLIPLVDDHPYLIALGVLAGVQATIFGMIIWRCLSNLRSYSASHMRWYYWYEI